jgi:hypothetical protein
MYENENIAIIAGIVIFFILLLGSLYLLQCTLSRNSQWLPYLIAAITFTVACVYFNPVNIIIFVFVW